MRRNQTGWITPQNADEEPRAFYRAWKEACGRPGGLPACISGPGIQAIDGNNPHRMNTRWGLNSGMETSLLLVCTCRRSGAFLA